MLLSSLSVMSFLLGCWSWPWCWQLRDGHVGAGSVFSYGVGMVC